MRFSDTRIGPRLPNSFFLYGTNLGCRKMVNVNTPLPFNLHNRALHARLDLSTSRSGRSSSVNEDAVSIGADTSSAVHRSPLDSQYHDPEQSPSLQTSRSATSLHPGDASYLPPEADPDNDARRPILNVRLIRITGGYGVGGRMGRAAIRGRRGRFGEERGEPFVAGAKGDDGTVGGQAGNEASNEGVEADTIVIQPPAIMTPSLYVDGEQGCSSEETTPLATEFQLQDVGKISRSWGD